MGLNDVAVSYDLLWNAKLFKWHLFQAIHVNSGEISATNNQSLFVDMSGYCEDDTMIF